MLTPRQDEIAGLIVIGLTNEEIALCLGISPRTVRAHTDELRIRLGVAKRRHIGAAYLALKSADESPPPPQSEDL